MLEPTNYETDYSIGHDQEIVPRPSTHTSERSNLCTGMMVASRNYRTNRVLNPGQVVLRIHYTIRSATAASRLSLSDFRTR